MALIAGGVPLGLLLFVVAAWGIDTAVTGDRVIRNVIVRTEFTDDQSVGGLASADLDALGVDLTTRLAQTEATLDIGGTEIVTDPVTLGVRVDTERLTDDALAARRGGFFLFRPFRWVGTFFSNEPIDVTYSVDPQATELAVDQLIETELDDPVEPYIELVDGTLEVIPGADGATIEPSVLSAALLPMMTTGRPFTISLDADPLRPDLDDAELAAVVAEANDSTDVPIRVTVLGESATVEPAQLRSWVSLDLSGPEATWSIDPATAVAELAPLFPQLGSDDQQARFDVIDNVPVIIPASESVICCADDTAAVLKAALLDQIATRPSAPDADDQAVVAVDLEPKIADADEGVARLEALGIIEEVGSFTTKHDCCQNRVTNIHLMADIVRGAIIEPGGSFSLNGYVGKRTLERGFLPAGAIASGLLEDQVGGGVSQFATTTFNAAFFSGLDFTEYQSHSLYFSRYPRGREATVSWPKPDLVLQNNSPYGVLIWTSYTDTTITVTMYSTKHIQVDDLGRTETPQRSCTRVTTTRQRTYDDGTQVIDTVFALYRPGEGLNCNGESTVPTTEPPETTTVPPTESTDTTIAPPPTTAPPSTTVPPTATTPPPAPGG